MQVSITVDISPRQHSMNQLVRLVLFLHQFRSSVLNDGLQIVGVFFQLLQHAVHYVELPGKKSANHASWTRLGCDVQSLL